MVRWHQSDVNYPDRRMFCDYFLTQFLEVHHMWEFIVRLQDKENYKVKVMRTEAAVVCFKGLYQHLTQKTGEIHCVSHRFGSR